MSLPAASVAAQHQCPFHGGEGPVLPLGSPGTLVHGLPAARLSDICLCGTSSVAPHLSPLAEGAATVLIDGLPAGRIGVKTLAGGAIVMGEPSVLIGGDTFSLPPFITIDGPPDYQAKVLRCLYLNASSPSGKAMYASMAASGRKCIIQPSEKNSAEQYPGPESESIYNGTGTDVMINFNPDQNEIPYNKEIEWAYPPGYSADVSLFHEMVHGDDMMNGRQVHGTARNTGRMRDGAHKPKGELRAVGVEPYEDAPYSENTYRKDRGLPPRDFH